MTASPRALSPDVLAQIARAISSIQYGCVQITIHDSHVVQIEKAEKIRLVSPHADLPAGGSHETSSQADRTTGSHGPAFGR
ncbi:MAG: YezD family protein [Candidatus Omnitrophica bacterium]|nr:YezD family protein [Candidatus Omnitrophota bacterium]